MDCDDDPAFARENRQAMGMPSNIAVIDGKPASQRQSSQFVIFFTSGEK
jgi:hypothetical protein